MKRIVFVKDEDGLYTADPKKHADAKLIPKTTLRELLDPAVAARERGQLVCRGQCLRARRRQLGLPRLQRREQLTGGSGDDQFLITTSDTGIDTITDPKTPNSVRRIAMPKFLAEEMKEYLEDYADLFEPKLSSLYELADTWKNYDRLRPIPAVTWHLSARLGARVRARQCAHE